MNIKGDKYTNRKKAKYYESSVSFDEDEEASNSNNRALIKNKRKSQQRQENSLGELTKNFIKYIKLQGGKQININDVVKQLKVKKRRIYDITNVLEGIGYIKKLGKNQIQWLKDDLDDSSSDEVVTQSYNEVEERDDLENELNELSVEESNLDKWIDNIKTSFEKLTEDKSFKEFGYVTFDDIKALTVGEDINLIAIKAPAGTSLEIPDPDHINNVYTQTLENMRSGRDQYDQSLLDSLEKKYQLFLDSPNGEINVFLVLNKMEVDKADAGALLYAKNSALNNVLQPSKSYKNLPRNFSDNDMIV